MGSKAGSNCWSSYGLRNGDTLSIIMLAGGEEIPDWQKSPHFLRPENSFTFTATELEVTFRIKGLHEEPVCMHFTIMASGDLSQDERIEDSTKVMEMCASLSMYSMWKY